LASTRQGFAIGCFAVADTADKSAACDQVDWVRYLMTPDTVVVFDQQNVARAQPRTQCGRVARRERFVALYRLFQIAGEQMPDPVKRGAHGSASLRLAVDCRIVAMHDIIGRRLLPFGSCC
jgi:hypothetical protein